MFISSLVFVVFLAALVSGERKLHFNSDGTFKVVQFTDLHFGSDYNEDLHTLAVQGTILTNEKPDLMIITGDLVSGYMWNGRDKDWFYHHWRQLVEPMIVRNISWAIALGNHDIEADLSGNEIVALDSSNPLSLTKQGPSTIGGATNYHLPIYSNSSSDISQMLWIFDSGQNGCQGVPGWGCVQSSQVEWYKNESAYFTQQSGKVIPGVAFFHIPLYEHLDLWNSKVVYGNLEEDVGVCCSSVNTGLFSAMHEVGDIKGVFCGHDHSNDYYGDYNGITLGYGRKTGYGGYGPPAGWKHGARVIELTQNEAGIRTWLRLEDGSIEIQAAQKQGKSNQFVGCCDMEGHGRETTTVTILYIFLVNTVCFVLVVLGLFTGRYLYQKCRRKNTKGTGIDQYLAMQLDQL
jgi:hypothetical protein